MSHTKTRLIQHKPGRDTSQAKILSDLKKEIRQLKRQLARSKKENNKLRSMIGEVEIEISPIEESNSPKEMVPVDSIPIEYRCDKCNGTSISVVPAGPKVYKICRDCLWRGPL